jgi:hypothetical protein
MSQKHTHEKRPRFALALHVDDKVREIALPRHGRAMQVMLNEEELLVIVRISATSGALPQQVAAIYETAMVQDTSQLYALQQAIARNDDAAIQSLVQTMMRDYGQGVTPLNSAQVQQLKDLFNQTAASNPPLIPQLSAPDAPIPQQLAALYRTLFDVDHAQAQPYSALDQLRHDVNDYATELDPSLKQQKAQVIASRLASYSGSATVPLTPTQLSTLVDIFSEDTEFTAVRPYPFHGSGW